jgi:hypothetical protein
MPSSSTTAPPISRMRVSRPVFGRVAAGAVVVVPEDDVPAVPDEPELEPDEPELPPEVCGAGVSGSTLPPSEEPDEPEPEFEPDELLSLLPEPDPEPLSPNGSEYC